MIPNTERYEIVHYVALLNEDSTLKMGIPLYVKVTGDMSNEQENLVKETASHLVRQYQKQINDYFEKFRNGGQNDKTKISS